MDNGDHEFSVLQDIREELREINSVLKFFRDRYCETKGEQKPATEVPAEAPFLCPKCAGPMVKRKGYRGPFYGCAKFPDCKGTRDLNGEVSSKPPARPTPKPFVSGEQDDITY